jgi:chemotaxis protein methyltransferase CheR
MIEENYNEYWQVIVQKTGYDFRGYSSQSLTQKLEPFISPERIGSFDELNDMISYDRISHAKIIGNIRVGHNELFKDTAFFLTLKNTVLPHLAIYPKINIWVTGCSTGEDLYSLTILLHELKLLERCNIIASDTDTLNLNTSQTAIYPLHKIRASANRYYQSGGKNCLSDYYTAYYEQVVFHDQLKSKINFVKQDIFKEVPTIRFHLILCRNFLAYFTDKIRNSLLGRISNTLCNYGYFCTDLSEYLTYTKSLNMTLSDKSLNIYRKII